MLLLYLEVNYMSYPPGFADRVKATLPQEAKLHHLLDEGAVVPVGAILLDRKQFDLFEELKQACWFNSGLMPEKAVA